ncbi:MAG: helix-turn-helix domain-containing protein [Actinomycetota bacterium]|nr:helix-turn-helix domain-containing protein [Actinomycetota bacterium]MDH5312539.1 helix-turn-helix domain-containing protein [Actinomycetota bacterium]
MRYRVEQLAATCDISVDTVRYYQSRGLLPPPDREGRLAWYGSEHADRIAEIRSLQRKGLTLAAIRRVVSGELGVADADLAAAVAAARAAASEPASVDAGEVLSLEEFSAASGVPASLIQAVEREGIRLGRRVDGHDRYTAADIDVVRTALRLLEFGLPLPQLLALARDADTAMRGLAERAVDLFDEHVRKPIRDTAGDDERAAEQMVDAFRELLPAVTTLVSHHFRRVLLETAEEHIEDPLGTGGATGAEATS